MKTAKAPGKATPQQKALLRAVKVIHAQMVAARTHHLRVKVARDIVIHHYEFRLVKIEAKFQIEASDSGVKKRRAR